MFKRHFLSLMIVTCIILMTGIVKAQEFPIAVGSDTTFGGAGVFDGTNYLAGILGDTLSQYSITAQLVSPTGNLVGNRISISNAGTFTVMGIAFDGSNYLFVWRDSNSNVNGRFINPSGNLVGETFTIATNVYAEYIMSHGIAFSDSTYIVVFVKNNTYIYGQLVSKSGDLIGGQIQISSNNAREISLAYDGTNYLIAWVEKIPSSDKDIYGQFVSKTGSLVGSNFLIDGGPYGSSNPTSLAYDGTRYLLAFHETPDTNSKWILFARFITTTGAIEETIVICDSTKDPSIPVVAFGNNNYLITWMQSSNLSLMGRFYNTSGVPIDSPFVIFDTLDNKTPIGGCGFGGNKFIASATRVDSNFTDGDVYGRFIQPTGIGDEKKLISGKFILSKNYYNLFSLSIVISYQLPINDFVRLKVYDVLGREVETLVDGHQTAGSHSVTFIADKLTSGVYFYKLETGNYIEIKKLILIR